MTTTRVPAVGALTVRRARNVGFTGTQRGMTPMQRSVVKITFRMMRGMLHFHHGDCIGADEQAHDLLNTRLPITVHPPSDPSKRAYCMPAIGEVLEPKPYLERNHDIVDVTDTLVAAPNGVEVTRSGTWATIRYANRLRRPILIVWPDGHIEVRNAR